MSIRSAIAILLLVPAAAGAQGEGSYVVPRTPDGHPDFQGVWGTGFLTTLERPPGVEHLVAGPEQAEALVAAIRGQIPDNVDPDVLRYDFRELALVRDEYRTSVIVDPPDGRLPYSPAGLELAAWSAVRDAQHFDGPEDRPLEERCLQNLGFPPIRAIPVFLPRQIYTRPWTGELSMRRYDVPIYEYGCHEGNYSMVNVLLAGRAGDAVGAAPDRD